MPMPSRSRNPVHPWWRTWPLLAVLVLALAPALSARSPRTAELTVVSEPGGALVSVHATSEPTAQGPRVVAGEAPLTKRFDFGKEQCLWLELERRGYEPGLVEVTPATGTITVSLRPVESAAPGEDRALGPVTRVAIPTPQVSVVQRGFSAEHRSEERSREAAESLASTLASLLASRYQVAAPAIDSEELRSVWRDARTAMELLDPIRLPYLARAPRLETRSAREAIRRFGERTKVDAVLLVDGKQNEETGGMKAGKVGIMVAGTAASFAAGYGQAMAGGDSFFTYNVYLPAFAEGAALRALLVHCATGDILWLNKGLWKPIAFARPDQVRQVADELVTGLGAVDSQPQKEAP